MLHFCFFHPSVFWRTDAKPFGERAVERLSGGKTRLGGYCLHTYVFVCAKKHESVVDAQRGDIARERDAVLLAELSRQRPAVQFGACLFRLVAVEERIEEEFTFLYFPSKFVYCHRLLFLCFWLPITPSEASFFFFSRYYACIYPLALFPNFS